MGIDTGSIGQLAETGGLISDMLDWIIAFVDVADYFTGDFHEDWGDFL